MMILLLFFLAQEEASMPNELSHAKRTLELPGHFILIEAEYDESWATVPATNPPGQPHYSAMIKVSEVLDGEQRLIAQIDDGTWTPNGCFEDDPLMLTELALRFALKIPQPQAPDWAGVCPRPGVFNGTVETHRDCVVKMLERWRAQE